MFWLRSAPFFLSAVLAYNVVIDGTEVAPKIPVLTAAEACVGVGLDPSGPLFTRCVEERAFSSAVGVTSREFTEQLRNFSCASDDHGTPVIRRSVLSLNTGHEDCLLDTPEPIEVQGNAAMEVHEGFRFLPGMLPGGSDLPGNPKRTTAEQAARECMENPRCAGFTMNIRDAVGEGDCWFKSSMAGFAENPAWQAYQKKKANTCEAKPPSVEVETKTYNVDILREQSLIAIIRGLVSHEECEALVQAGGDLTGYSRAYTSHGTQSSYRRSYSSNIYPPLDDLHSPVTQATMRMFAATRNLTGYLVYPGGQEPVNGVLYQHDGDEYRPHCDGGCNHERYQRGERVATSILYCIVPEKGGATSFTKDAMKVVAQQPGDMLLFSYWPDRADAMSGWEAEHSGCPLRGGKKWIATQWYREGVHDGFNWQQANQAVGRAR